MFNRLRNKWIKLSNHLRWVFTIDRRIRKHITRRCIDIEWLEAGYSKLCSRFDPTHTILRRQTIFIGRETGHSRNASMLHEYYHARMRIKHGWNDLPDEEYLCEKFALACLRKMGYSTKKAERWLDTMWNKDYDTDRKYKLAFQLLKINGVI